jgi:ribonucleotide monophosphatase NagD (HAD superfamily)
MFADENRRAPSLCQFHHDLRQRVLVLLVKSDQVISNAIEYASNRSNEWTMGSLIKLMVGDSMNDIDAAIDYGCSSLNYLSAEAKNF